MTLIKHAEGDDTRRNRAAPILLGGLAAIGVLVGAGMAAENYARERLIERITPEIIASAQSRRDALALTVERFRQDARMLSGAPAVQNFARDLVGAADSRIDAGEWIGTLFQSYIDTHPEVLQVRLIEADIRGMERVRFDRDVVTGAVSRISQLQAKGGRDYVQSGLKLAANETYVSELNLNREFGKVQVPHVPTLRVVSPVILPDQRLGGLVVINLAAKAMMDAVGRQIIPGRDVYVMNEAGDFLLHPDPARAFGFELGRRYRWQDEFSLLDRKTGASALGLQTFAGADGRHYFVRVPVSFSKADPAAHAMILAVGFSEAMVTQQLGDVHWGVGLTALLIFAVVALIAALYRRWRRRYAVQEGQLAAIVSHSNDAIIGIDLRGQVNEWNLAAERMFGYGASEAIGRSVVGLVVPEVRAQEEEQILRRVEAGEAVPHFHAVRRRKDGSLLNVSVTVSPIRGVQGQIIGAAKILRDISQQIESQKQLSEREARWRQLADSMPQMVWTCSADGDCDFLSAQWVAYTGIPEAEQHGYRWLERLHPEDRERSAAVWRAAVAAKGTYSVEYRVRRHDGVYRWFDTRGVPLLDEQGLLSRWIGSNTDIEDRKQAEEKLLQLNVNLERRVVDRSRHINELSERLSIATRSVGMGVWDWNIQTNELIWDEQMYRLYFFDPQQQTGREPYSVWSSRIHPEDRARTEALLKAAVAGEKEYITEFRVVGPDGQSRYISAAALLVRDGDGKASRMVGVNRDTTSVHEAEVALLEAKSQAEKANQAKTSFLANMSHEIRTPMNAVMNLCYLLEQTPLNFEQQDLTGKMRIASRSLLGLINDILDLSKIEAGQMGLASEVFSLRVLIDDLSKVMQGQARAKRIALRMALPANLPDYLRGDSLRLNQVLTNLLSNALKFTDRGHVGLTIESTPAGTDQVHLRFVVEDSGIGISPEAQALLFSPFVQGDESTTRRFGGTGLGLAIVKRLVTLMGGTLGVESQPGVGSRFWFELKLPIDRDGTLAANAPLALDTLVVDDNPQQRETVKENCRSLGWRVEAVASGKEAIQRVADRLKSGKPYDAVIVDWLMPEMDGVETIGQLAKLHGPTSPAAILLVTASDHESLRAMPGAGLADAVLGLPTDTSTLFNAVHQAVARNSGSVDRLANISLAPRNGGQRLMGVRILLVDDSSINLDVGQRILEKEGAKVLLAVQGAQALDIARAEGESLDIVLMDVQMPVMDGIEASKRIRSELGERLPILALTAGALVSERQRAIDAGMNDFVSKPFDAEALILRIRQQVERVRGRVLPIGPTRQSAANTVANSPAVSIPGLALEPALERVGGDEKLLKSLLRRLLEEFADFGKQATPDADARRGVAQVAHKLRGAAGNVGAERLQRLAGEIEICARDPQCQQIPTLLNSVSAALGDLRTASAAWLETADHAPSVAVAAPVNLAAALDVLRHQLRQNNLTALDTAEPLKSHLRNHLGEPAYQQFATALESLRFAEALALLPDSDAGA